MSSKVRTTSHISESEARRIIKNNLRRSEIRLSQNTPPNSANSANEQEMPVSKGWGVKTSIRKRRVGSTVVVSVKKRYK